MDTELEARGPRQPALMMLKEWLELESRAELSRDGFACYPRHLVTELRRNASACRRRNGGDDIIARVSAALSRRVRAGLFWNKKRGVVEREDGRVPSCPATPVVACGRRDDAAASSSPAMSPRRASWQGASSRVSVDGAGLDSRRSHETEDVAGPDCVVACRSDEEREQEQRLSPVSVMDFPGLDDQDDGNSDQTCGRGEDDETMMSPTFERSVASIRRASQVLLLKIRQFEQLADLDLSEVDAATTATEDATSCHIADESDTEDETVQDLLGILQVSSPVAACRFQKLLEDFFREGLASSSCHCDRSDDDSETAKFLLATAKSWLDGRRCCTLRSDWKADMEEIERLGWWRRFRDDEQKMLAVDVEGGIFWSLMDELVDDLC